ncbi:MAG: LemA family protein [Acidobacteria bacterium]|nr:LemA family protein [Acidobacteriota bacterium]MDA1233249.1 LemA family protein [Acidobacteriota bacterium]
MSVLLMFFLAFAAVVAVLVFWAVGAYNGLVALRQMVRNGWAQIDVQLKRRHDLIPNLVETVKGYATHERETLEKVVQARGNAVNANGPAAQGKAEGELGQALSRLMLLVEQYPDLKANQNFLALQEELTSTENKVGFSRQAYNDSVMAYNTSIAVVPANIIANTFGFTPEEFFEITVAAEREAPKVSFN